MTDLLATASSSVISQQAFKWLAEAEADKTLHRPWQDDVYRYAMPWRRRQNTPQQQHDQDELFDPTAIDTVSDFSADMQNTFTPTETDWLTVEPADTLNVNQMAQVKDGLAKYKDVVFSEIRRSNFYEASQECYPDLAAGTTGMCIQDLDINEPLQCQAIPIPDLLLVRGAYGGVDFRARCLKERAGDIASIYRTAKIPQGIQNAAKSSPGSRIEIKECFWRKRDQIGKERWQYVLMMEGQEAESFVYEGQGSCSLITARWKTDSTTAWGIGPLYTVLPLIKTLDQLCYLILKHVNRTVDPVTYSPDDGTINLDQGLVPGTHVFTGPDSEIKVLESGNNFEVGFFERESMQNDIRRALFQNKPEQPGKTPPTASQWLDQNAAIDRRMGAPVGRLVTEWQLPVFQRFAFLLSKRGVLPSVKLNGQDIRLRPQSPLIRSQRQQEVLVSDHLLEMAAARFGPETLGLVVDAVKTVQNWKNALGDKMVILRSEEDIKKMAAMAAQVAQSNGAQMQQAA